MNLTPWLEAATESTREIAAGPLAIASATWDDRSQGLPDDLYGVYIPLITETLALQLGLLATRDVCDHLARSLMGMDASEPLDSEEDVLDAVGEVTNMVAGGLKVKLASEHNISVGVPLAFKGRMIPCHGSQSAQRLMRLDDRRVWLVVTGTPLE